MKRIIAVLTTVGFLGLAGAAGAEEINGKVQAIDPQSRTILLDDGSVYTVQDGVAFEDLQPGTEVMVSYEEQDGQKTVTDIQPSN